MNIWNKIRFVFAADDRSNGILKAQTHEQLLANYQPQLRRLRQLTSLPEAHYKKLYSELLQRFAELVQLLPASESHHHAHAGGLLQHSLETAEAALRIRQSYLLPQGGIPEKQSMSADLYTYAVFTAALIHDIGKPLADQAVTLYHADGRTEPWAPLGGPLSPGSRYSISFHRNRQYRIHERIPLLMVQWIIPIAGQVWISSDQDVLEQWSSVLSGVTDEGNVISEIIRKADQYSVANNLMGGQGAAIAQQPATPLHQRLVTELRRLVNEVWPINRPGGVAFLTEGSDTIWLVSKRSLDELRASMIGQGQTGIPPNPRIMDELMQHGYLNASQDDKAARRVRITIGDWEQALTCIGLRISKIWGSSSPPQPDKPAQVSIDGESTQSVSDDIHSASSVTTNSDEDGAPEAQPSVQESSETQGREEDAQQDRLTTIPFVPAKESGNPEVSIPEAAHEDAEQDGNKDEEDLAKRFMDWLADGIKTTKLDINTAKAMVHTVPDGVLIVSPRVFRVFAQGVGCDYKKVQRKFQRLRINKKTTNGENIWTYDVQGERKSSVIKGMIIMDPKRELGLATLPDPNTHLVLAKKKFLDN
jgi:integrating conjugative element relaxase (TIGR03760 family)